MAQLRKRQVLKGMTREVGAHLKVDMQPDGAERLEAVDHGRLEKEHWSIFREAVAYALEKQTDPTYKAVATARRTSPFRVATADFLHVPEIDEVDLSAYHGQPDDVIKVKAHDDVMVTEVGIIIVDEENRPVEMGKAVEEHGQWVYRTRVATEAEHVRIIVDAADLPGNLGETRVEKKL